jgi:hypothetical protein
MEADPLNTACHTMVTNEKHNMEINEVAKKFCFLIGPQL